MANICDNKFYIYSEAYLEQISEKLNRLFENDVYGGEITYIDDNIIEGWFESRWSFPNELFDDFFKEFEDEDIYMRCLSEEYGCGLVSMNIYSNGSWWEPQYFKF